MSRLKNGIATFISNKKIIEKIFMGATIEIGKIAKKYIGFLFSKIVNFVMVF